MTDYYPAVYPPLADVMALAPVVRSMLNDLGVSGADVRDLCQDILSSAWFVARAGGYCPLPERDPREALAAWLYGFARNIASRHRARAHVRREVPSGLLIEGGAVDPRARIEAQDALTTMRHLSRLDRAILLERADGETLTDL